MLVSRGGWDLVRASARGWSRHNASLLAAGLSYYSVFALPPLLLVVIALTGRLFGEAAAEGAVASRLAGLIGRPAAEAAQGLVTSARSSGWEAATWTGAALLAFTASQIFTQLRAALDIIWEVPAAPEKRRGFKEGLRRILHKRFFSFAMVLGVGLLLTASFFLDALLSLLWRSFSGVLRVEPWVLPLLNQGASVVLSWLMCAAIYRFLPDAEVRWRDVWQGALITALLLAAGRFVIGLYFRLSDVGSPYGVAGSLVVILVGIRMSAMIFLFGAEFTSASARRDGELRPGTTPA